MLGPTADLLSLLYAAVAAYTLWQLAGRWRSLVDAEYTDDDRNLAGRVGFLLLTPIGVLAHELAHLIAARELGARETSLSFRVYWGYVQYAPSLGPVGDWIVAVAGPAASLVLGLAALVLALRLRAVWRDVAASFGHATLLLVLLLYPALSFVDGAGDFLYIYTSETPTLAVLAGAVHALGLGAYLFLTRQLGRRATRETHADWSCRFAGQRLSLTSERLERLHTLEAGQAARRLLPEERAELEQLRELQGWIAEHNAGIASLDALESAAQRSPDAPS